MVIILCADCNEYFVANKDGETLWPLPNIAVPEGVPEKVGEAYRDARLALAAGSKIGALMAGRTTLFRMLRDKGMKDFKQMVDDRIITPPLYGGADQLRLWAGIAGHDDIATDAIDEEEVKDIINYLGTVLEAVYTHQAKVDGYVAKTKELKAKG